MGKITCSLAWSSSYVLILFYANWSICASNTVERKWLQRNFLHIVSYLTQKLDRLDYFPQNVVFPDTYFELS